LQYDFYNLIYLFDLIIRKEIIRNCKVKFNFTLFEQYNSKFVRKFEIAIRNYFDRQSLVTIDIAIIYFNLVLCRLDFLVKNQFNVF